ncbi:hypothetical protein GC096_04490 [Paenibacillus sp. LMG 31461]|uniref:Transposase n=1 Tax=Paenibacillus plantarum TaxID=2654975 RepID=A0ABX1X4G1_9BACL|nr:hypothetical protein [Paenibacillus plantarum]NOU63300.1 hypothetical protein [Paenibacillus plantarum]
MSKDIIAVAFADEGREAPRYWGTIAHKPESVRKLIKQLSKADTTLEICYEAGPTGYELYRDTKRLAQLFRAGELTTAVYVPSRDDEALRDLIRARTDAREDYHRSMQRVIHFLLRLDVVNTKQGK